MSLAYYTPSVYPSAEETAKLVFYDLINLILDGYFGRSSYLATISPQYLNYTSH